jgi:hypothetical protein
MRQIIDFITALSALSAVVIAFFQLKKMNAQILLGITRDKMRTSYEVCTRYENDTILNDAKKTLWQASKNGTDYSSLGIEHKYEIIGILNYLDGIACGIHNDIYDDKMVRHYLWPVFKKYVNVFILGKDEESYVASNKNVRFSKQEVPFLIDKYNQWSAMPDDHYL